MESIRKVTIALSWNSLLLLSGHHTVYKDPHLVRSKGKDHQYVSTVLEISHKPFGGRDQTDHFLASLSLPLLAPTSCHTNQAPMSNDVCPSFLVLAGLGAELIFRNGLNGWP